MGYDTPMIVLAYMIYFQLILMLSTYVAQIGIRYTKSVKRRGPLDVETSLWAPHALTTFATFVWQMLGAHRVD